MGEVYRAEDTNLSRQVAIKVLPDEYAHDAERLARFEREAKLLASLNHPNIAAIHGLEEHEGKRFLVLELVEGQTLSERLKKGRIPLDETLDIGRQIAEGLEAAHEKGIIHRDLKPANVKVTPEGKVKILDFGLAKAFYEQAATADMSHSPTITDEMTRPGVVLGTAAYMSPEQAKGKSTDRRADIWAFGCILYECLTGKRAFPGETITESIAKILESEPDWAQLPVETSSFVRAALRQCLQKDKARRLRDIADVWIGIQESATRPSEPVAFPRRFSMWWTAGSVAAGALAATLVTVALMRHSRVAPTAPVTRAIIRIAPGQWLDGVRFRGRPTRTAMAVSGDGSFIVYSAIPEDPGLQARPQIYLRRLNQMDAAAIPGTEGGISPFLSPDGRWVGFWAGGKLIKTSVERGVPAVLCDVTSLFGASWGIDNNIIFSPRDDAGLFRVSADGGKPEAVTVPDKAKEEFSHRLPHCLPDGKGVLFTITREPWDDQPRVAVLDLQTRKWQVLIEDAGDASYLPTGHIIFLRQGSLMAAPFDLDKLKMTGQPVPVVADVMQATNSTSNVQNTCAGQFATSDSGWLIYVTGSAVRDLENSLVWVDHEGTAQPITSFKGPFHVPRLAPDGQRIGYSTIGSECRLHVYDIARGTDSPLTGEGKGSYPVWTADGRQLIFSWWKSGLPKLHWQPADGSSPMERLTTSEYIQCPGSVTPDGATLVFVETDAAGELGIRLLDLQSRRVTPVPNSRSNESYPAFSPDGRWLAYSSDESGREEVYVRSFPSPGSKWKLSLEGGTEPLWARNGEQLYYRFQDQVWAVNVRTGAAFTPGKPRLLFEKPGYRRAGPLACWDISLDAQQFLMVKMEERKPQPVSEMILVQNWFEELKRLCPTGR
jgi:serine/threonine-protein kinase